jgi:hypothetical protein
VKLREALDLCSHEHAHEWVIIPGAQHGRPATTMLAGLFDAGAQEPRVRPLAGHSIAVYEPDARLSMVWTVPDEDEENRRSPREPVPEWAENDDQEWRSARDGWVVILLGGSPIWQTLIWYIDWGSGIGGYVPDFEPRFGDTFEEGGPKLEGWDVSSWAAALARLLNDFSHTGSDFARLDPTPRLVPSPSKLHPVDLARDHR